MKARAQRSDTPARTIRAIPRCLAAAILLCATVVPELVRAGERQDDLRWESLGPDLEVNVVAVAPATGDTILTSAFQEYTRQAYRSENGGATWTPLPELVGIHDFVVDPTRPAVMHAVGGVVSRSLDGGVTWELGTDDIGAKVITLDPACGRRLYVGTGGGRVLRSGDRGENWTDIGPEPPLGPWEEISDIVVDPSDSNVIYASSFEYESGGTGIYKTTDGGETWQWLGWPGEMGQPPGRIHFVSRMHISEDDPNRLLAGSGDYNFGVTGAVYETSNGGSEWNTLSVSGISDITYLRTLALEPLGRRRDTVFLGMDHWGGPNELFYSTDSGRGWRVLVEAIADDSEHGFDIATDDSMRICYTTGSGVVRSSVPRTPSVVYAGHEVDDSVGGNGDGHVDPGETVLLRITLRNSFANASTLSGMLVSHDVFVSVTQPHSDFPDLVWGASATSLSWYEFEVDSSRPPGPVEFLLEVTADGYEATETLFVDPGILLVDDDDFGHYGAIYERSLEDNHLAYSTWHVVPDGAVTDELVAEKDAVVWFTSGMRPGLRGTTLSPEEEDLLSQYLDEGGRLFLSSQDYLGQSPGGLTDFAAEYLHVDWYLMDTSKPGVAGLPGDPIGDGLAFDPLDYAFDNLSDSIFPDSLAARVMNVVPGMAAAAIRYPAVADTSSFRTVFFAFPFEAVPEGGEPPCTRATLLRRVIEWLVPEGGLVPTGIADRPGSAGAVGGPILICSPNPARGPVRLDITSPGGRGDVLVAIYAVDGKRVWGPCATAGDSKGSASVMWDGCTEAGDRAASGVYLVRASVGGRHAHGKIVLLE